LQFHIILSTFKSNKEISQIGGAAFFREAEFIKTTKFLENINKILPVCELSSSFESIFLCNLSPLLSDRSFPELKFSFQFFVQIEETYPLYLQKKLTDLSWKLSMWARNRVGMGLSYRPAKLHSLAELVPWNRFLGSLKV